MKLDGLTHPKTKELALRLGIPLPYAVGLLDFLWAFVAQQTPQGNIGKWSNGVIAQESQWSGDADEFVAALIEIGFLDEDKDHRLLIHDWSEHAPNWVHAKLKKKGLRILSGDLRADLSSGLSPIPEATTSLAKPSQGKDYSANAECGSPDGEPPEPPKPDPVPHQKIVALYHQHCPSLAQVAKLTPARQEQIRARWRNELPTLEQWAEYFQAVEASDFLTGRVPASGGRQKPWKADIDFLIKQGNVVKMAEGKYD